MKKSILFSLFFSSILGFAGAQAPVFNNSYLPQMGKFFSGRNFFRTQAWPVTSGPNQIWDFTPLQANYITNYNFAFRNKPTTGTQGAALFPGAEMTQMAYFGEDSIENFLRVSNGQLVKMGYKYKGWDGNEIFTPNRIECIPNFDYGDVNTFECNSVLNIVGAPPQYFRFYDTLEYAGYGTMITTFATYNNVPMFKRNFASWISMDQNGPFSLHLLGKHWYWYLPQYGAPYIRYSEELYLMTPDQPLYDGYIGFIPQVGIGENETSPSVHIFPTRIHQEPWLVASGLAEGINSKFTLTDIFGRTISAGKVEDGQIPVFGLSSGVYQLSIQQGNRLFKSRIVKE